ILAFVNDLFGAIAGGTAPARRDGFRYDERDRFPPSEATADLDNPLGVIVADTVQAAADRVADEIVSLLSGSIVRDRATGVSRPATPADVAILFRSRDSHRDFEAALDRRGVPTYVYKGLGFLESDEVQDAVGLLRYLADPLSNLRASAFVRSRLVRVSDAAVAALGGGLATAIVSHEAPETLTRLDAEDRRVLALLRASLPRWLARGDRETPIEGLEGVLHQTADALALRGGPRRHGRDNPKK